MKRFFLWGGAGILMLSVVNFVFSFKATGKIDLLLKDASAIAQTESNNNGEGNQYYYEHLLGRPKECTLYKAVDASGDIQYGSDESGFEVGWTVTKIDGIKETCPDRGSGCTVYSCRVTD